MAAMVGIFLGRCMRREGTGVVTHACLLSGRGSGTAGRRKGGLFPAYELIGRLRLKLRFPGHVAESRKLEWLFYRSLT